MACMASWEAYWDKMSLSLPENKLVIAVCMCAHCYDAYSAAATPPGTLAIEQNSEATAHQTEVYKPVGLFYLKQGMLPNICA